MLYLVHAWHRKRRSSQGQHWKVLCVVGRQLYCSCGVLELLFYD